MINLLCAVVSLCLALVACSPIEVPTPTPPSTPPPMVPSTTYQMPSPTPEATYAALSTNPRPGWALYQNEDYGWTIAYPQVWVVQPNRNKLGEVYFQSPETGTEIQVEVMGAAEGGMDWLDWLRENSVRALRVALPREAITANVTFLGHPAFFHIQPAYFGTGDQVSLVFADENRILGLHLWSSQLPPLEAESRIYTTMLSSFTLIGRSDGRSTIPTGWESGANLVTILPAPSITAGGNTLLEITGSIEKSPDDSFLLVGDNGQHYTVSMPLQHSFLGMPIDYEFPGHFNLEEGNRVKVIGTLLPSGDLLARAIYARRSNEWQIHDYRALLDVDHETLDPHLLTYYPQTDTTHLWLRGQLLRVLPYLVNEAGNPLHIDRVESIYSSQALAYGELQRGETPSLAVEQLYIRQGTCETVTSPPDPLISSYTLETCYNWQQFYPSTKRVEVVGTVLGVLPNARVIVLQQPSQGFVSIALEEDGQLLAQDGISACSWDDLTSGQNITAVGISDEAGTLSAQVVLCGAKGG